MKNFITSFSARIFCAIGPSTVFVGIVSMSAVSITLAEDRAYESVNYKTLKVSQQGPVVIGRFDNPPRYTMNQTVVSELSDLLTRIETDDSARVLVLTGASENVFISHYDVGEIGSKSQQRSDVVPEGPRPLHGMHKVLLQIEALPKPVIAAINGRAHGGGYETSLACDFRFLSSNGTVGLPEVGIGIIPGGGGTQRLPRLIGHSKAKQLIMLAKTVDADTALALGMVDFVAEPDNLLDEAIAFANQLAKRSPIALASVKQSLNQGLHLPLEEAMYVEQAAYYRATQSVNWGDQSRQKNNAKE